MDSSNPRTSAVGPSQPASTIQSAAPAAKRGSPLRLGILLLVLAVCIGALAYDYRVAKPAAEAANLKIQKFMEIRNQMSVAEAGPVTSADIQRELGRGPTWIEKEPTYTVEWYCWWGKVPLFSTRRHFLTVLYVGDERRFSTQHLNGPPAEDDLPTHFIVERNPASKGPPTSPVTLDPPPTIGGTPPPGMGSGTGAKGKGKGKNKGKGGMGALPGPPGAPTQLPATEAGTAPSASEPNSDQPTSKKPDDSSDKPADNSQKPTADKPAAEAPEKPTAETLEKPVDSGDDTPAPVKNPDSSATTPQSLEG